MPNLNDAPQKVKLGKLIYDLRKSVTQAAYELEHDQAIASAATGMRYVIPRARITARMGLTIVENEVRGLLWWKEKSQNETSLTSTLEFEMVALPRDGDKA